MSDLSILGVFAHPDDEQVMSGVFAQVATEGIRTGLICATRGEAGQIGDPSLATPETLARVREAELRAACVMIGVKNLWFLDYRDSGWIGSPENDDPTCFHRSDKREALGRIVKIVRDFKPTVIVTFDPTGGYGHLDHLTVHQLTNEAFEAAADPGAFPEAGEPWQTTRLYYSTWPRSIMERLSHLMAEVQPNSDYLSLDTDKFGLPDSEITNSVDVSKWLDLKAQSLRQHRTQSKDFEMWAKLPAEFNDMLRGTEHYVLAAGTPLPDTPDAKSDLFAGLR
jgi:LmbE family N-acetylglucosaminyl deacetylase